MLFHRRKDAQLALYSSGIVITDVVVNHLDQFLLAGKTPAVITFAFQNAPEPLHGSVVNAVGYTGHALGHASLYEFVVECSASILEPSVAVEQGMGVWVGLHSLVKGLVDKRIVIAFTDHIGHDTPVTEVQDGAQIELMYLNALIPFELRHIGKPFLIGFVCIELAVEQILRNILGVLGPPGAATVIVFHGRPYISGPADPQHPLVVDMDAVVVAQIIVEPSVALIWAFRMELFEPVGQLLILSSPAAQFSTSPFMVS